MSDQTEVPVIPNRISIDRNSPYFYSNAKSVGVKIDDKVIMNCYEFCRSEGWADLLVRDNQGRPKLERGRPVTVRAYGKIENYWRAL